MPLLILAASAVIHFLYFGHPMNVVFDEVHIGNFMSHYWSNTFYFDVHPPLAKLLLAGFGYITGANLSSIDWTAIGDPLPTAAVLIRLVPTLAGTILPLIVYWICRRLDMSRLSATLAALLISLENSLLVQSRFIMVDMLMLFFGFLSVATYLEAKHRMRRGQRWILIFISILCVGAATSIKWTGLGYLLVIILMEVWEVFHSDKRLARLFKWSAVYIVGITLVYVGSFAVHFTQVKRPGPDIAFVSPTFMDKNFVGEFTELNIRMFQTSSTLYTPHSYSSKWYTWPFLIRPIFYWESTHATTSEYIYLMGNPSIYWLGLAAVLALFVYSFRYRSKITFFVLAGYLVNYIPFIFIGRVMFLYHYETALVFSIMAIACIVDMAHDKRKKTAAALILVVAVAAFLYWSPLTYGLPLTDAQLAARMWLPSWR